MDEGQFSELISVLREIAVGLGDIATRIEENGDILDKMQQDLRDISKQMPEG